jgi:glycosyltransferase involved in cell wall biosynthesis
MVLKTSSFSHDSILRLQTQYLNLIKGRAEGKAVGMLVSVITSTYNRSRFIPALLECYRRQDYNHDLMEWLILDDSEGVEQKKTQELFSAFSDKTPNIFYIHSPQKQVMGHKLNHLCSLARGDIIVVMDDDDFYPPTRVSTAVKAFQGSRKQIAGCSKVYMYFQQENEVHCAGPYSENHALNCTMAFRSSYLKNHRYDDAEVCAVERVFTNNFSEPMIQLDSQATILHMVHADNTFKEKKKIGLLVKTTLGLSDF